MVKELKQKCKCGHAKEVHGGHNGRDDYDGPCCVQYPGEDGFLKSCGCSAFVQIASQEVEDA